MEDIRAFTTPEMFAEIQLEYQERGKATQQTDVVELNAGLLDLSTEANRQIASVRFFGMIRETPSAAPEAFDEVWHLSRPADASSGWVIAGIQQFN
jgi:predicted lipid-binding transport protein (Tim44 family)